VDRVPAGAAIVKLADLGPLLPAARAALIQAQYAARLPLRPAAGDGLLEQGEQRELDMGVDACGNRAYQAEHCFPRSATSSIACSLTVSSKRAISALAAASSDILAATLAPPRPRLRQRLQRAFAADPADPHDRDRIDLPALGRLALRELAGQQLLPDLQLLLGAQRPTAPTATTAIVLLGHAPPRARMTSAAIA
jgi:hypothetical protein